MVEGILICNIVPAQVGGAAQKGYRAVTYVGYFSAHFYQPVLILYTTIYYILYTKYFSLISYTADAVKTHIV